MELVRGYPARQAGGRAVDARPGPPPPGAPPDRAPGAGRRGAAAAPLTPRAAPVLGPYRVTIREWLTADRAAPRKQRHTARRVWERLVDEQDATVAESTVRRVRRPGPSRARSRARAWCASPQAHGPGEEAEVDFGEVTVILAGARPSVSIFHLRLSHSGRAVHVAFALGGPGGVPRGPRPRLRAASAGCPRRIRYDNLPRARWRGC